MREKNHLLFVFLLIFFQSSVYAQQHRIDSLLNYLNQTIDDTTRIKSLNRLVQAYNTIGDYEKAMEKAKITIELSEKFLANNPPKKTETVLEMDRGKAFNNIGTIYKNQGNYPKALENYFEGLKLFEKVSEENPKDLDQKKGISLLLNSIGNIYANQQDYPNAIRPIRETAARRAAPASAGFRGASPCSRRGVPTNRTWPGGVAPKRIVVGPAPRSALHSCL